MRIAYVVIILIAGYILSNIATRLIIKFSRKRHLIDLNNKNILLTLVQKGIIILALITAALYMGFKSFDVFLRSFINTIPTILTILILLVLGIYVIRSVVWLIRIFMSSTRIGEYIDEESNMHIINLFIFIVQIVLYLLLVHLIISYIEVESLYSILNFVIYPSIVLLFLIMFVAAFNPIKDYSASFYLKNAYMLKAGNIVRMDKMEHEIIKISNLSTELKTKEGNRILVPNRLLASKELMYEHPSKDIETLVSLKQHFVPQLKSHCGPACAQMALALFKIPSTQEELGMMMKTITRRNKNMVAGTHPKKIISAVDKYTEGKVIGAWIDFDKIYDLEKEVARWLADGALVIVDYKKKYLFPSAKTAHYSLVVGVKGDQFLIVDPSQKSGGVYFSDYRDVAVGMDTHSELINGKRGYIVLAPKGSAAFKRINDRLIYFHPSMYSRITKQLERRLNKMTNSVKVYETMPGFIKRYLKEYKKSQIQRVWRPEQKK